MHLHDTPLKNFFLTHVVPKLMIMKNYYLLLRIDSTDTHMVAKCSILQLFTDSFIHLCIHSYLFFLYLKNFFFEICVRVHNAFLKSNYSLPLPTSSLSCSKFDFFFLLLLISHWVYLIIIRNGH